MFKGRCLQEIYFIWPNEIEVNILRATEIIFISDFLLSINEIQLIAHNGVKLQHKVQPMAEREHSGVHLEAITTEKKKCKQWGNKLHKGTRNSDLLFSA